VAVKVQHKNIAETLLSDLETLDAMLSMQGSMMPETDFRPMISEWTGEVAKEIDFTLEAENQAKIGNLLATAKADSTGGSSSAAGSGGGGERVPMLSVPTLHPALGGSAGKVADPGGVRRRVGLRGAGSKKLLIMEFIEGERITDGAEAHLSEEGKVKLMEGLISVGWPTILRLFLSCPVGGSIQLF
jgi:hypothetical protein